MPASAPAAGRCIFPSDDSENSGARVDVKGAHLLFPCNNRWNRCRERVRRLCRGAADPCRFAAPALPVLPVRFAAFGEGFGSFDVVLAGQVLVVTDCERRWSDGSTRSLAVRAYWNIIILTN